MIKLQDVMPRIGYKISGGSEFLWRCFGNNARFLDYYDGNISLVFDAQTQEVYQVNVQPEDYTALGVGKNGCFWVSPDHKDAYYRELEDRDYPETELGTRIDALSDTLALIDKYNSTTEG